MYYNVRPAKEVRSNPISIDATTKEGIRVSSVGVVIGGRRRTGTRTRRTRKERNKDPVRYEKERAKDPVPHNKETDRSKRSNREQQEQDRYDTQTQTRSERHIKRDDE